MSELAWLLRKSPSGLGCACCGTKRAPAWRAQAVELPDPLSGGLASLDVCDDVAGSGLQDGCASQLDGAEDLQHWFDRLLSRALGLVYVARGLARMTLWEEVAPWLPYQADPRMRPFDVLRPHTEGFLVTVAKASPWCLPPDDPRWRLQGCNDRAVEGRR